MCGIVGIVAHNSRVDPEVLERATNSLAHRGPDDSGTVILKDTSSVPVEIGLGNRRLAVLDLSSHGHQPMQDRETGNYIVYNGEIYNFREVREELIREGVHFDSDCDTEVLLKAYGQWSENALSKLRGMFAFAIWDAKRHRLFLARDPMGIKPLYHGVFGGNFLFASELRTMLDSGLVPRKIDRAGLLNYLNFGSLSDPITLVEGVSCLLPGRYLIWECGKVRETQYWDALRSAELAADNLHASSAQRKILEEDIFTEIENCVAGQTVSDVPLGVFLSGGIDSSSLVGLLSRKKAEISTFSIVFSEADYDEGKYARAVAKKFTTDHHELRVSQHDALNTIPEYLCAIDQPTIDGLNTFLVSRATRAAGIKVALSGLGGDELFAGYSNFKTVPQMERFSKFWGQVPGFLRSTVASAYSDLSSVSDQSRKLATMADQEDCAPHPYFLSRMLFTPRQIDFLMPSCDSETKDRAEVSMQRNLSEAADLDPINRVSYLEMRCYMRNTLLRDSDVMSMAHGLEIRVPLIDHQLAEKLLSLPGAWKTGGKVPKPLLVRALRGELPHEIVYRKKQGFSLPFEHWLREELRAEIEAGLRRVSEGPLAKLLESRAVAEIWEDFLGGRTSWSRPWSLYVLQRWCESHGMMS